MGGGDTTTTQKADPWEPAQPYLEDALKKAQQLYKVGSLAPQPYGGQRVAGMNGMQQGALQQAGQAMGSGITGQAQQTMAGMMDGDSVYRDLDAVKAEALGGAIPAATAQFAGNGMTDSSAAQQEVGRAATQAIAPIEYGAWDASQDRGMKAGALAPSLDAGSFLPAQMGMQFGGMQQGQQQAQIDAAMGQHYERTGAPMQGLQNYSNLLLGYGGQGGTSSATQPGASTGSQLGGAAMSGLGAYGMMAGMGLGGPVGAGAAGLLALSGLL